MAEEHGMIEPFEPKLIREKDNQKIVSYGGTTPFLPLCSGPKAASTPSRQKQIPSSNLRYQSDTIPYNIS